MSCGLFLEWGLWRHKPRLPDVLKDRIILVNSPFNNYRYRNLGFLHQWFRRENKYKSDFKHYFPPVISKTCFETEFIDSLIKDIINFDKLSRFFCFVWNIQPERGQTNGYHHIIWDIRWETCDIFDQVIDFKNC